MPVPEYEYPFDPTGTAITNRITQEAHVLTPPSWRDFYFIIPQLAPFFRESLIIRDVANDVILQEGVDWYVSHWFSQASRATAKPIYGSISFFNKEFAGLVELEYQTLGGEWTVDAQTLAQTLAHTQYNPRITTWEQITTLPHQFPVIDHQWHLHDMVGMTEVRDALLAISNAIEQTLTIIDDFYAHQANTNNPHEVGKGQVGLSNVLNYPMATLAQAQSDTFNEAYMSPHRTWDAIKQNNNNYYTKDEIDTLIQSLVLNGGGA